MRRSSLVPLAFLLLAGCGGARAQVDAGVEQPAAFNHKVHADYFASGRHREDQIQVHLKLLREKEAPEELREGRCLECHDAELTEIGACAGCHRLFQDATLRGRGEVRTCTGCHRGAWTGNQAGIPTVTVCRACHEDASETPWVQIHTVPGHVHFSHRAHVRYGGFACTRCHEDMALRETPPTSATVFSMDGCIQCHDEHRAETDCLTCHK